MTNTLCRETQGLLRIQWAPHIFLFFMLHVNKMKLSVSENEELGNKTLFCQTGSVATSEDEYALQRCTALTTNLIWSGLSSCLKALPVLEWQSVFIFGFPLQLIN